MTVLEKNAAGCVDTDSIEVAERPVVTGGSGFWAYLLVGLAAVDDGGWCGRRSERAGIDGDRQAEPDQIAESRAQQLAEDLKSRYWAQLAKIYEPRAEGMVEFFAVSTRRGSTGSASSVPRTWWSSNSRQHQARIYWVNGERAQDMVTFKRGWEGKADS